MSKHLFYRHSNVPGDLTKQYRRDVSTGMKRYRRASTVRMAILLVRAALTNFRKSQFFKYRYHFTWLEDRGLAHIGDYKTDGPGLIGVVLHYFVKQLSPFRCRRIRLPTADHHLPAAFQQPLACWP